MFQTPESIPSSNGSIAGSAARQRGNSALGTWLRANPDIALRVQTFEAIADETHAAHEGANGATAVARERFDDAKANLAQAEADAQEARTAIPADRRADLEGDVTAKRAALDAAHERASATNRAQGNARDALNTIIVKANALAPDGKVRLVHIGFKGNSATVVSEQVAVRASDGKVRQVGIADPAKVVDQQVAVLRDLKAQVNTVRLAPPPKEDIAEQLLAGLANDARLRISLNSRKPEIVTPVVHVPAEPTGDAVPTAPDALALMYSIFPEATEVAVRKAVDERYESVSIALDPLQKNDRLKSLAADIRTAERIIAEAIIVAFDNGQVIAPPSGLSAEALLGIE